jgi:hypothetical protein
MFFLLIAWMHTSRQEPEKRGEKERRRKGELPRTGSAA